MEVVPGRIYKHFKGDSYLVLGFVYDSETCEKLVHYKALYGEGIEFVRPLEMFISKVDKAKYPDVKQEYRFELQEVASVKEQEQTM